MSEIKHWIPLESNPEVLSSFAHRIGVLNIPDSYKFHDIFGLDDEMLAFIPTPVVAVILLFPIDSSTEKRREDYAKTACNARCPPPLFYMKQTIGNACGTIALLHAIANSLAPASVLKVAPGSFLDKFLQATWSLSPEGRGCFLERPPPGSPSLDALHQEAAQQGSTAAPEATADVDLHFNAFVLDGGDQLWELDGRMHGPIEHGASSRERFLRDVAKIVRIDFVEKSNSQNFSLMALSASLQQLT